jgi:beta-phosphoglucomutase-like phosphatase (HAD superfamily)
VRAIIFDFDGLLTDTESTSFLSWQYEWSQWGLTLQVADFFVNHGGDVTEDRSAMLATAVGPRFDRTVSHQRRVAYREKLHAELDLADGLQRVA